MRQSSSKTPQQVRIIGGLYKRTPLFVPDIKGLRPTPDRVRETLFNWVGFFWDYQFDNKRILDLFAGSGALGLEASSRGVQAATVVEKNREAVVSIKKNIEKLKIETMRIYHVDALSWLEQNQNDQFDLIFLDPPFDSDLLVKVLPYVKLLQSTNSLLYIESATKIVELEGYKSVREGRAGAVYYELFQRTDL